MPDDSAHSVLADPLPIEPLTQPFDVAIRPPGSKSLTNRALLLAALADGTSTLRHPLVDADDAQRMIQALGHLGAEITMTSPGELTVHGVSGRWTPSGSSVGLNLNNAGTATRFLTAAALLSPVPVTIDGNARMRQRPIGELTEAIAQLGGRVEYLGEHGCPPLRVHPIGQGDLGDCIHFGPTRSSQFISAMLLIAPWLPRGLTISLEGNPTSASYIRMTLDLLERVGASVRTSADLRVLRVGPAADMPGGTGLGAFSLEIEPDLSGATYFWAAAAMAPGSRARITGLQSRPMQGDGDFVELLARMGATIERPVLEHAENLRGDESIQDPQLGSIACRGTRRLDPILADMADMPDAAVTLAVVASFASGVSVLRGVRTLRDKECDRISALQRELAKVGVRIDTDAAGDPDAMTITPPPGGIDRSPDAPPVVFETYHDHRMAMALALVGLGRPGVRIADPRCVDKTYPGYWADLATLRS